MGKFAVSMLQFFAAALQLVGVVHYHNVALAVPMTVAAVAFVVTGCLFLKYGAGERVAVLR